MAPRGITGRYYCFHPKIGNSLHVPVVGFHGVLLVFLTRIAWTAKTQRVMPQRYLASANLMPKKKEGREAPPSGHPISRFPACQSALPESIGALRGRTPIHGKFYRGHARYACRRTPRQTSGLPAGAEPSFESKDILASTNPKCPDTFENNRMTIPDTRSTRRGRRTASSSRGRRRRRRRLRLPRDDQDVLYCRLPLRAAGKSERYPPPKGISATFMCGSLRIGLADAAEDRRDFYW